MGYKATQIEADSEAGRGQKSLAVPENHEMRFAFPATNAILNLNRF
jgi:hypothetical protein